MAWTTWSTSHSRHARATIGWRRTSWGLAVIVALWSTIAACAVLSARVSRLAAALLLPYLGWTGFAA